jgi:RNA polymerase sigma-70 factor (ECF subfamily)
MLCVRTDAGGDAIAAAAPMFAVAVAAAAPAGHAGDAAMDRFAAGDLAAFTEVYAAVQPRVERTLGRLTRQRAAAEDLAQETMLRIYRARGSWQPGARLVPWAHAIARRLFIDRVRSRRREQAAYDAFAHRETCRTADGRADATLAARRKASVLAATIAHLPPMQREAVQMICLDGKSLAEASAALGEANGTVRVRVHRARCALAAALAEH